MKKFLPYALALITFGSCNDEKRSEEPYWMDLVATARTDDTTGAAAKIQETLYTGKVAGVEKIYAKSVTEKGKFPDHIMDITKGVIVSRDDAKDTLATFFSREDYWQNPSGDNKRSSSETTQTMSHITLKDADTSKASTVSVTETMERNFVHHHEVKRTKKKTFSMY